MDAVQTIILLLSIIPNVGLVDYVEVIEINTMFDGNGALRIDQIIFWEVQDGCFKVVDWRLVNDGRAYLTEDERNAQRKLFWNQWAKTNKGKPPPFVVPWQGSAHEPLYDYHRRMWKCQFRDPKQKGRIRTVYGKVFRRTWTLYDPEMDNRDVFGDRKELSRMLFVPLGS